MGGCTKSNGRSGDRRSGESAFFWSTVSLPLLNVTIITCQAPHFPDALSEIHSCVVVKEVRSRVNTGPCLPGVPGKVSKFSCNRLGTWSNGWSTLVWATRQPGVVPFFNDSFSSHDFFAKIGVRNLRGWFVECAIMRLLPDFRR